MKKIPMNFNHCCQMVHTINHYKKIVYPNNLFFNKINKELMDIRARINFYEALL